MHRNPRLSIILLLLLLLLPFAMGGQVSAPPRIRDLRDVQKTNPVSGDALIRVGAQWKILPHYDANNAPIFAGLARIVADDATDNQAAIAARNTALNAAGGGVLWLPVGKIRANSNLAFSSNVYVRGQGPAVTELIMPHSGTPSTGAGITLNNVTNVGFADMTIRGNGDNDDDSPYDLLICTGTTKDVYIQNVHFKWGRHAGFRTSGVTGVNYNVTDCLFTDIGTPNMTAVVAGGATLIGGGDGFNFSRNTYRNIGNATTFQAVYVSSGNNGVIANCLFDARSVVNNNTRLQCYGGPEGWIIQGNIFLGSSGATGYFCYIGTPYGKTVGNHFVNCIVNVYADHQTFDHNTFFCDVAAGTPLFMFQMGAGAARSNLQVTNNHVYNTNYATNKVFFYNTVGSSNCLIANNKIYNCLAYYTTAGTSAKNIIRENYINAPSHTSTTIGLIHATTVNFANNIIEDNTFDTAASAGNAFYDSGGAGTNVFRQNNLLGSATVNANVSHYLYTEGKDRIRTYYATATYDPPSLNSSEFTQTTVTVTGAAVGDPVQVSHTTPVDAGMWYSGQVTNPNTVTVTLHHQGVGTDDLATGTLKVLVSQKQ